MRENNCIMYLITKILTEKERNMYFFCYARSQRAKRVAEDIINSNSGEIIRSIDSFSGSEDGVLVLVFPIEAAMRIMSENKMFDSSVCSVVCVLPDASCVSVLKRGGTDAPLAFEAVNIIGSTLGSRVISFEEDSADFAPDLMQTALRYPMHVSNQDVFNHIIDRSLSGEKIEIYTDMKVKLLDSALDSLAFNLHCYRNDVSTDFLTACRQIVKADREDKPSIIVSFRDFDEDALDSCSNVVVLCPCAIVLGIEITGRANPQYTVKETIESLRRHTISPYSIAGIATMDAAKIDDSIVLLKDYLNTELRICDNNEVKAYRIPLRSGFALPTVEKDICTACASVASKHSNVRIALRRVEVKNALIFSCVSEINEITIF